MKLSALPAFCILAACSGEANHIGNPIFLPLNGIGNVVSNAVYNQRRGRVEVIVKSQFPMIVNDISVGGGDTLTQAMDVAHIPPQEREARIIQLQGDLALYESNPGALVTALMVYGG